MSLIDLVGSKRSRRKESDSSTTTPTKRSPSAKDKEQPTRGKVDDEVLATLTPEGKDLVNRVLASTDLIIVVESGLHAPKRERTSKP